jgi:hypothetical protein
MVVIRRLGADDLALVFAAPRRPHPQREAFSGYW